jgi:hypothetical protein
VTLAYPWRFPARLPRVLWCRPAGPRGGAFAVRPGRLLRRERRSRPKISSPHGLRPPRIRLSSPFAPSSLSRRPAQGTPSAMLIIAALTIDRVPVAPLASRVLACINRSIAVRSPDSHRSFSGTTRSHKARHSEVKVVDGGPYAVTLSGGASGTSLRPPPTPIDCLDLEKYRSHRKRHHRDILHR